MNHSAQERPHAKVILIAEDEAMVNTLLHLTLERAGYVVLSAHDGEEALQLSHSYPGTIDLLLTDMVMPNMTGLELCRSIGSERPETKILFMSGSHRPASGEHFLEKPFTPKELRTAVREMVELTSLSA
jgi:CheY-like chemotaxis protein